MGKRKPRDNEIVCMCSAYEHPHRLGGGACDGSAWCVSYRAIDSFECNDCRHGGAFSCEIIDGIEPLNPETCVCVADELRTGMLSDEYGNLPLDVEDYREKQHRDYYDVDAPVI